MGVKLNSSTGGRETTLVQIIGMLENSGFHWKTFKNKHETTVLLLQHLNTQSQEEQTESEMRYMSMKHK